MRFGILGPVEVVARGVSVSVAQPRHRALLAYLLLQANRVVTPSEVMEALWGGAEPQSARTQLHIAISVLRRALRAQGLDEVVVTRPGGYLLVLAGDDLDATVFDRQITAARAAQQRGAWSDSAELLRSGLALWRGRALAEVTAPYADAARHRLHKQQLTAQELLAEAELALGQHDTLLPELDRLVGEHPTSERLACQLMLAQYRVGRRADALQTARRLRRLLVDEQGLDPSRSFIELEKAILNADPALDVPLHVRSVSQRASAPVVESAPAQLPFDVPGFTGREKELGQLDEAIGRPGGTPVVLIAGTAGVGKTALALHWGHRHRGRFPDGQLYVNLRGFDPLRGPLQPLAVLQQFLRSLGVDVASVPDDVDEAAALFRSLLARRRVLIMLDNAADADQVQPLLPGSAGCATVVTSRTQLRWLIAFGGARLLRLDSLRPQEAAGLLQSVLDRSADELAEPALRTVAKHCAYLPLALRLAAAQLTYHPQLTVADYASQLADGDALSILDEDADPKDAVSSALGLSYRGLEPEAQRLFRLLGLTPGHDFGLPAAAALLHLSNGQAFRPLQDLANAHLVREHRPGRYVLHDLLRSYAGKICAHELSSADREAAIRRLVDFYAQTVYEAYPLLQPRRLNSARDLACPPVEPLTFHDRAAALEWHDQERENLVGAICLAARHSWHRTAWQLTANLLAYFIIRRRWSDWLTALRVAKDSAEQCDDLAARSHIENALGIVHKQTGRYEAAREHYSRAIELAAAAGKDISAAAFTANLGGLCINEGNLVAAVEHLRVALSYPAYGGDPQFAIAGHINLGIALGELERYAEATDVLSRALADALAVDDVQQACISHENLAIISLLQGDTATARRHAEQQLHLATEIGDPLQQASGLDCLGSALANEDPTAARTHWEASHQIYLDLGHRLADVLGRWLQATDCLSDRAELARADAARRRAARRLI